MKYSSCRTCKYRPDPDLEQTSLFTEWCDDCKCDGLTPNHYVLDPAFKKRAPKSFRKPLKETLNDNTLVDKFLSPEATYAGTLMPQPSIVYELREKGVAFCETKGSDHYKREASIEPIDVMVQEGWIEGFCLGNIVKYGMRYIKDGRNKNDLKKIADYAHILCGYQISQEDKDGEEQV